MKLFHASHSDYKEGAVISLDSYEYANYYLKSCSDQKKVINTIQRYITEYYPNYPKRCSSLFAFDSESIAGNYDPQAFVYEIEMDVQYKGPFVLVNELTKALSDVDKQQKILREYFNPNLTVDKGLDWQVYEYVDTSFRVIRKIENPQRWSAKDTMDREKAQRLFGRNGRKGILG